jgi:hypothetical protein
MAKPGRDLTKPVQGFRPEHIELAFYGDGRLPTLTHDLTYTDAGGNCHTAPEGMPTDGRTGGRLTWLICGQPYDDLLGAYIIHDHGCYEARSLKESGALKEAKRVRYSADQLFCETMAYLGASRAVVLRNYAGVRWGALFGGLWS